MADDHHRRAVGPCKLRGNHSGYTGRTYTNAHEVAGSETRLGEKLTVFLAHASCHIGDYLTFLYVASIQERNAFCPHV